MKKLVLLFTLAFAFSLQAQKIPNATFTDCNGNTQDIYSVLATGKVLVLASKGLDCGICKSHAANFQNFISQNSSTIAGWGAMIWLYQGGTPNCSDVNNWVSTYSWTDVFTFVDANKEYLQGGTPRYYVINPADSMIVYSGGNFSQMQQMALMYASGLSVEEDVLNDVKIYQKNEQTLMLQTAVTLSGNTQAALYNLVGQVEQVWTELNPTSNGYELQVSRDLNAGVYLLHVNNNGTEVTQKVIWKP
ncbi:MAG: T9SS type A sorting domain-containing protein [Schleiferiaceae bacterium]|nr:T9SS type A sorting domain-containing protein [Schleiferiaceae bacterium]